MTNRPQITRVFFATFFILGLTVPLLGVTVQDIAGRFSIPLEHAGSFQTVMSLGAVVASVVAGQFLDRLNGRFVLAAGTGLLVLSMTGLYAAPTRDLAMACAVVMGVGFGLLLLAPNVMITRLNPENPAGPLNAMHFLYGIGAILAPQLVTLALLMGGARTAYLSVAAGMLLLTPVAASLNLPPPNDPAEEEGSGRALHPAALLPFMILFFCNMGVEVGFNTWIVTQAQGAAGTTLPVANLTASIFWVGFTASRGIASLISRRIRALNLLIGITGMMISGYTLMLAFPGSPAILMVSTFIIGVGTGPLFPSNMAATGNAFPSALGRATGILSAVGNLGPMTVPLVQGWIGGGRDGGMELPLALSVVMMITAITLQRRGSKAGNLAGSISVSAAQE